MRRAGSPTQPKARRRFRRLLFALPFLVACALLAGLVSPVAAGAQSVSRGVVAAHRAASHHAASPQAVAAAHLPRLRAVVHQAIKHDTSPPLRTLKAPRIRPGTKIKQIPLLMPPHAKVSLKGVTGGLIKLGRSPTRSAGRAALAARATGAGPVTADVQRNVLNNSMPGFEQDFEGVSNINGVLPPDTEGAVGPNDYVQMINLSFAVYDKQGNLLYGPVPNTTLWQGFGGPCETFNGGDPVALYDEQANRWFLSQLAYPGGSEGYHLCIAVSQTGDPTGAWYRYDFEFSANTLPDYPKYGVWPDAYYATANQFLDASSFTGVTAMAFDRAEMLAGQQAQEVSFSLPSQYSSLLPSNAEGGALGFNPPAGAPNPFFMSCDAANGGPCSSDQLDEWNFHVDWSNPANSTFGNNGAPSATLPVAAFNSNLCNYSRDCIPQPGTSQGLDPLSDRLLYQAAYRNLGGGTQAVVLNQTVNVSPNPPATTQAGVRWYELTNNGSGWSVNQQGTYAPDSDNRWMASTNIDASGDIAVGFSVSSASTFPSIRVAGRLAGDPPGQLSQGETTMMAGTGSQTDFQARWGDYSAMQVDPTDGCTFWYTNEYLPSTSDSDWHTRIGSFKFPSCTAGQHGTLSGTVTDASTGKPVAGATVTDSLGSTTTDSSGNYSMVLPVGSYNLTVSAFGYSTQTVTGVQVTNGGTTTQNVSLTPAPSVTVSGTVTDGSGHGWPLYASLDINGRPGGPVWTNPATGQYSVSLPENATYSVKVTASLPGYQVVNDTIAVGSGNLTHNIAVPVDPSCTAAGYQFDYGTPALSEPFDGTTIPAGWTVTDNNNSGMVWGIDDPENLGNLTGGTGNFADINSDYYGPGHTQDTSLITPVLDLSGEATPVLRFHTDYNGFPGQTADVDMSTDGGATWTNVWEHTTDSVPGPALETVQVPQAGGDSSVQFRFHFTATWGWWWEVDDVTVQNQSCAPIPGGLVVGTVDDANTSAGINGATVTTPDSPGTSATTVATPQDPNISGGYYQMFVPLTGAHPFTASKAPYQASTQTVTVAADSATQANFTLGAGRLSISPAAITSTQVLGSTKTTPLTITNTGTAAATWKLDERGGAFQILTEQGAPTKIVDLNQPASPAWLGSNTDQNTPGVSAGPPADPTWSTIASYPTSIMDNSADFGDGKLYSVGGYDGSANTAAGYVYDPTFNTWSPIANMLQTREKPNVAYVDGKLYVSGGWDNNGNPIAETDAYDPTTNSWTAVSPNPTPTTAAGVAVANGIIYYVAGCADAFCTPSTTVESYDPATDTWATLAPYPHPDSWESCGGINGKVYCAGGTDSSTTYKDGYVYDPSSNSWSPIANMPIDLWASAYGAPNGMLVVSSGITNGFSTVTNQGYAYDPSTDSWTALPNAQFVRYRAGGACGFYKIGGSSGGFSPTADSETLSDLTQCGVVNIPWLTDSPSSGTLQPGQSVTVTVTTAATTADTVTQPGTYTAQFGVEHNTPYVVNPVNVTMNVTPPSGWGKITGTVTGTTCKSVTSPITGAQVQANSKTYTFSLKTDKNGAYTFWAPAASNPFTLIVSRDGWISQTIKLNIKAQKTLTENFDLTPTTC